VSSCSKFLQPAQGGGNILYNIAHSLLQFCLPCISFIYVFLFLLDTISIKVLLLYKSLCLYIQLTQTILSGGEGERGGGRRGEGEGEGGERGRMLVLPSLLQGVMCVPHEQ